MIDGASEDAGYYNWYIHRTRRFHSRMGALHVYVGELFKSIARRTDNVLPEALPLEERRDKEKIARKVPGRRPKRGGHGGGRGGMRSVRRRAVGEASIDAVVPTALGDDEYDPGDVVFGDNQPVLEEENDGQNISASQLSAQRPPIQHHVHHPTDYCPSFNLGLTPGGSLLSMHNEDQENQELVQPGVVEPVQKPTDYCPSFNLGLTPGGSLLATQDDVQEGQEPVQSDVVQHVEESTDYCPSFNLGLTPGGSLLPTQEVQEPVQPNLVQHEAVNANILGATPGNDGISPQSTISPDVTKAQPSIVVNPTVVAARFGQTYELRHSKRVKKKPKCGIDGHKCVKHY
ncbi:hypothetical protein AgCh_005546 [Apium graveolens]